MNSTWTFLKEKNVSCVFAKNPFTKKEGRAKSIRCFHKVRSVSPNEIIIEVDSIEETYEQDYVYRVQEENVKRLKEIGFELYIFDHRGKSPYIKMYDFQGMTRDNQKKFFDLLVERELTPLKEGYSYDNSFYCKFHWCPLEFAEHYKPQYKTKHKLIRVYNEGNKNKISPAILEEINQKVVQKTTQKFIPVKCPFVEYALNNKLPDGTNRNRRVLPNIVAVCKDEEALQKCAEIQEKPYGEFKGWLKLNPTFSCATLRNYACDIDKSSICSLCLLGGVKE